MGFDCCFNLYIAGFARLAQKNLFLVGVPTPERGNEAIHRPRCTQAFLPVSTLLTSTSVLICTRPLICDPAFAFNAKQAATRPAAKVLRKIVLFFIMIPSFMLLWLNPFTLFIACYPQTAQKC